LNVQLTSGSVKQFAGYPCTAIHNPNQHNHDVTEHGRYNRRSQEQALGHKRVILSSGRVGEQFVPGLPDKRVIHFCSTWLGLYPDTQPGNNDFNALARLTGSSFVQIQTLFERVLMFQSNLPPRNDPYSTLRSGSSALQVQSTGDDGSTLPTSIQDSWEEVNVINGAAEADPVSQSHLIAQFGGWQPNAPDTNVQADEAIDAKIQPKPESYRRALEREALERAAREARDRTKQKCKRTNVPDRLKRDPDKPFQCTRKCGQNFARKGDWERHEAIRYPQQGWVCMIDQVYYDSEGNMRCAYCGEQDPTQDHVREKHRTCLRYCRGGEKPFCERVFFRREHFKQHFSQVHPTLNSKDYANKFYFQVADSALPRWCGFCASRFPDWENRSDHIGKHFKEEKCMREWQDPSSEAEDEASVDRDDDDNTDHGNYSEEDTYY
jgi:hypothetical protein